MLIGSENTCICGLVILYEVLIRGNHAGGGKVLVKLSWIGQQWQKPTRECERQSSPEGKPPPSWGTEGEIRSPIRDHKKSPHESVSGNQARQGKLPPSWGTE